MKRILIYDTKYGSAAEVANRIKTELGEETQLCNIMTSSVPSIDAYDTVIIGGSIYMQRVQKQITEYCNGHLSELLNKNVGLFLCAGEQKEDEQKKYLQMNFPEALYQHATAKGVLGYAFSFEKMKFLDKMIMKKIKGDSISVAEYSDEKIASFTQALKNAENI
ncbi:MAG TPA: flavodoxin domain-containing protein [Oscillospiraceae bacterium]|nr:flavodoxin domain-containing protein [Oscillospiraceae bacterium]